MAAFNIMKVSGVSAKEALNILLTSGGEALVKNATDVAESLPTAMLAGTMGMKGDQLDLARQAAALYGLSTDVGGDVSGNHHRRTSLVLLNFLTSFLPSVLNLKIRATYLVEWALFGRRQNFRKLSRRTAKKALRLKSNSYPVCERLQIRTHRKPSHCCRSMSGLKQERLNIQRQLSKGGLPLRKLS